MQYVNRILQEEAGISLCEENIIELEMLPENCEYIIYEGERERERERERD